MSQNMVQKQANQRLLKKNTIREKREFNPDLKPGEESNARRTNWRETTTTPTTINPLTGEKVGEGEPTTEVTKEPVDEITQFGGEEVPQGHKDEFDPNLPIDGTEEVPE